MIIAPADAGATAARMPIPVPAGWRLRPAAGTRVIRDGEILVGGSPLRILTLSARAASLVRGWLAGQPVGWAHAEDQKARGDRDEREDRDERGDRGERGERDERGDR
ncbi:MAG: hypothetical protein JOY56_03595, partial [Solirubrobacterales bacterium]|nr:hypothetical protein [Solirubrobacterales bacterium]